MSLQKYEKSFEKALSSLATPTVDVSVLTSAPQAALLLQGITLLAACVIDASLENDKTRKAIKLLNTPGSFKASLYQMGSAIGDSFRVADRAMLKIKINLEEIPDIMASMVTAYAKPEDEGSTFLMNLQMESFSEILNMCSEEATKARQSFDDTMKLIQEMIQVTTATAGHNEEQVREAEKLLAAYSKHMEALEEKKRILNEKIEKHKKEIEEAKAKYEKAADKMTDSWTVLTATFADSVDDIFKLFNGAGSMAAMGAMGRKKRSISEGDQDNEEKSPATNETMATGNDTTTKTPSTPSVEGASQTGSKIPDTAVGNLRVAAELAEKVYIYQKKIEQTLFEEDVANRMAIGKIAAKMETTKIDKLKLDEIIGYLSRAIKMIGRVQENWSILMKFFSTLESVVIGPMTRNLETFDKIVKQENLKNSGVLRVKMVSSGFKGAALCLSVARSAGIYNQISEKYVMPLVDQSVGKLTMSKEEAKAELSRLEPDMKKITEESHRFIDEKLKAAKNETIQEMMRCKEEFLAALSKPASRLRLR